MQQGYGVTRAEEDTEGGGRRGVTKDDMSAGGAVEPSDEPLKTAITEVVACVCAETNNLDEKRYMLHQIALAFTLMASDPELQ